MTSVGFGGCCVSTLLVKHVLLLLSTTRRRHNIGVNTELIDIQVHAVIYVMPHGSTLSSLSAKVLLCALMRNILR